MHIEPPTPRIALLVRARRGAIIALTALACAALMSACGSSASTSTPANSAPLKTNQTRAAIEETIFKSRHIHATVVCPAEVRKEKGVTFVCVATTPKGVKTPFQVTEANNKGYVTYQSQ